jgi:hypothetical protein
MEARGFLAGARVRFGTNATHKKPPPVLGADGGAVYLLGHETPNFEIGSVFRAGQYNRISAFGL